MARKRKPSSVKFLVSSRLGGIKNFKSKKQAISFKRGVKAGGFKGKLSVEKTRGARFIDNTSVFKQVHRRKRK